MELIPSHIDTINPRHPLLEQDLGKPTRRRAHIKRIFPMQIDRVLFKIPFEFLSGTGDIVPSCFDNDSIGFRNRGGGFGRMTVDRHQPRFDRLDGTVAALEVACFDKVFIQTHSFRASTENDPRPDTPAGHPLLWPPRRHYG